MSQIFFTTLTEIGEAKHANAVVTGRKVNYHEMAVGDGNGTVPMPSRTQTALVNQVRRDSINQVSIDPQNPNHIIVEQVIPEDEGGWWIREVGIYDDQNDLIAVASVPETYKPLLQQGSGKNQIIRIVLLLNSTAVVNLKIDPSIVMATQKFVADLVKEPSGVDAGFYGGKTKAANFEVDERGRIVVASEIVVPSVWDLIPTEYIGDVIYVKGLGEMWWTENEWITGYRTKECGSIRQTIDRNARSYTIALDGGFFDKTQPKFKGLWSFINENNLLVPEQDYMDGEFFFCEAGGNMVKTPNQDDQFWRNKGIDRDTANAAGLGINKADSIKSHQHIESLMRHEAGLGRNPWSSVEQSGSGVNANTGATSGYPRPYTSAVGAAETAPTHTRTSPFIHV